jgi:twitching motility two-component system response regulator PilH
MARVLIVDDSPTETHKLTTILEKNGHAVIAATNGEKKNGHAVIAATNGENGVDVARQQRPDVILMDIVMPGLNGFQATRQLSKDGNTNGIPIIIVTTKDQDTDRVWGMRQGARAYLTKPVDEGKLLGTIEEVLA